MLPLLSQRRRRAAEQLRSASHDITGLAQRPLDILAGHVRGAFPWHYCRRHGRRASQRHRRLSCRRRAVLPLSTPHGVLPGKVVPELFCSQGDGFVLMPIGGAVQRILELTNMSRPTLRHQEIHPLRRHRGFHARRFSDVLKNVGDEKRNVLAPLGERWNDDAMPTYQPVHQVLAQGRVIERDFGRADEADLRPRPPLVGPEEPYLTIALEQVEQEYLRLTWKRLHFVEKERSFVGLEQRPVPAGNGPGIGTFHMTD